MRVAELVDREQGAKLPPRSVAATSTNTPAAIPIHTLYACRTAAPRLPPRTTLSGALAEISQAPRVIDGGYRRAGDVASPRKLEVMIWSP